MENVTFDSEAVADNSGVIDLTGDDDAKPKSKKSKISAFESSSAYLLVYKRRTDVLMEEPELSIENREKIIADNIEYEAVMEIEKHDRLERFKQSRERIQAYEILRNELEKVKPIESLEFIMSSESLHESINSDVTQLTTTNEYDLATALQPIKIDNTILKCEHNSFNPHSILKIKVLDPITYAIMKNDLKYEISPELKCRDLCKLCFKELLFSKVELYVHIKDLERFSKCINTGPQYWISKPWLVGNYY